MIPWRRYGRAPTLPFLILGQFTGLRTFSGREKSMARPSAAIHSSCPQFADPSEHRQGTPEIDHHNLQMVIVVPSNFARENRAVCSLKQLRSSVR